LNWWTSLEVESSLCWNNILFIKYNLKSRVTEWEWDWEWIILNIVKIQFGAVIVLTKYNSVNCKDARRMNTETGKYLLFYTFYMFWIKKEKKKVQHYLNIYYWIYELFMNLYLAPFIDLIWKIIAIINNNKKECLALQF